MLLRCPWYIPGLINCVEMWVRDYACGFSSTQRFVNISPIQKDLRIQRAKQTPKKITLTMHCPVKEVETKCFRSRGVETIATVPESQRAVEKWDNLDLNELGSTSKAKG